MSLLLALLFAPASATSVDGVVGDFTYEGSLSESAPSYTIGKPVSISHSGGNIIVRCTEAEKLSARLPYTVIGSNESAMEAAGNGIGLKVGGDGKGGGVVGTRMSSKSSGVGSIEAPLTVNIPIGASAISVSQSGSGWVQLQGCSGAVKISAGSGGAFASGQFTVATLSAAGGTVKLVQEGGAVLLKNSSISAPGGSATVILSSAQGGTLSAKGGHVSVQQAVMGGAQTETAVSGSFGIGGPTIGVAAKENVEISQQ